MRTATFTHTCALADCGATFTTRNSRTTYCSVTCGRRARHRREDAQTVGAAVRPTPVVESAAADRCCAYERCARPLGPDAPASKLYCDSVCSQRQRSLRNRYPEAPVAERATYRRKPIKWITRPDFALHFGEMREAFERAIATEPAAKAAAVRRGKVGSEARRKAASAA